MLKKLLFLINLIIFISSINIAFAEIIPLKKPSQSKEVKEQKLLIDVLRPLPKPITKKINIFYQFNYLYKFNFFIIR